MSTVIGRNEGAFSATFHEAPPVVGLQVVMVGAEPVEELEDRRVGLGPVFAVVGLQERQAVAAFGGTGGIEPLEGAVLMCVGAAAEVGDSDHALALRDDGRQERILGV